MRRKRSISHRVAVKHIPQRTCVACRKIRAQRELIRLVSTSEGSVEIDTSGREAGRGAYLCRTWECWEIGLKGSRLEHALRTTIIQDNRERLIRCGKDFLEGVNSAKGE